MTIIMKIKRKSWFTLIEIIIVVIIIGVLMLMWLGFNQSQLKSLKSNTTVEQVKSDFDTFFLQVINSSSYQGNPYNEATLTLTKWENEPIKYAFSQSSLDFSKTEEQSQTSSFFSHQNGNYQITKFNLDWSEKDELTLIYKPYQLGCSLQGQEGNHQVSFSLLPKWGNEICFSMQTAYCRIEPVACKGGDK